MKVLIIDNYDSFTWNLAQIVRQSGLCDFEIHKNDDISFDAAAGFDALLISPGPGTPTEAGKCKLLIRELAAVKPILGICLGHQAIAEVFGGSIYQQTQARHGIRADIRVVRHDVLFEGLGEQFAAGLYHSWAVDSAGLPSCLEVTAMSAENVIMAIRHIHYPLRGVQFHPESIMTPGGSRMINNWLQFVQAFISR